MSSVSASPASRHWIQVAVALAQVTAAMPEHSRQKRSAMWERLQRARRRNDLHPAAAERQSVKVRRSNLCHYLSPSRSPVRRLRRRCDAATLAAKDVDRVLGGESRQTTGLGQRVQHVALVGRERDRSASATFQRTKIDGSRLFGGGPCFNSLLANDEHSVLTRPMQDDPHAFVARLQNLLVDGVGAPQW